MLLLFAVFFLPAILFQQGGIDINAFDRPNYHFAILVTAVPQALLILYILWLQPEEELAHYGFRSVGPSDILAAVAIAVGMFAVLLAAGALILLLPEHLQGALRSGFRFQFRTPNLLPLALVSSLAIAYREEIFFRAYVLTRFEQLSVHPALGVPIAAVIFSLGHAYQGIGGALVAFILGLYLGWVYLGRRNIHVVSIAHALYNFSVLALSAAGIEFT